ncbi:hypothetical protein VLK31_07185 [Variovorax sp. H27-G14]|uniref:hypothetical protein n=1 Tax=Variovorax sp. H27-G14 TaxID=3111914 RepID=UPI0038FCAEA8
MTVQRSTTVRNARLDAIETAIGTSAKVRIYSGAQPANCAAAASGTLLVEWALGADWAANASAGVKAFNSTPVAGTATGNGTAGHYRIVDSAGTTCHEQGTVTATGGGGDVTIDNTTIASGQTVNISSWTVTEPGA